SDTALVVGIPWTEDNKEMELVKFFISALVLAVSAQAQLGQCPHWRFMSKHWCRVGPPAAGPHCSTTNEPESALAATSAWQFALAKVWTKDATVATASTTVFTGTTTYSTVGKLCVSDFDQPTYDCARDNQGNTCVYRGMCKSVHNPSKGLIDTRCN
ncbi:unnamed protein product, partial [Meganyctiphanes norvegica]